MLLIVALIAAADTHWILLQSVAWTAMLADNLQTSSLKEAVQLTFDGEHPCSICRGIAAGKKAEKKADFPAWLKKLDFFHTKAARVCFSACRQPIPTGPASFFQSVTYAPPAPPPRNLAS